MFIKIESADSAVPSNTGDEGLIQQRRTETITSTDSTLTVCSQSSSVLGRQAVGSFGNMMDDLVGPGAELEEFDPLRKMSQSSDSSRVTCGKGDLDLSSEWHPRSASVISSADTGAQR